MTTTIAQVLREAARLVREVGWTQKAAARLADSRHTGVNDPGAVCFCAWGAICRAAGSDGESTIHDADKLAWAASHVVEAQVDAREITAWNDHEDRTQAEVEAALLRAADAAEGQQP